MPIPWGPIIGAASSLAGPMLGGLFGGEDDSQSDAAELAMMMQNRQNKQNRADLAPWREVGGQAVNALWDMIYGAYGGTQEEVAMTEAEYMRTLSIQDQKKYQKQRDKGMSFEEIVPEWKRMRTKYDMNAGPQFEDYEKSPYYDFLMEEGTRSLERGAAARGNQLSGAENKALTGFGQNLASQDYDNWLRRWYQSLTPLQSLAGLGQTAATQTTQLGQQYANNMSGLFTQMGEAGAAKNLGQQNTFADLMGNLGDYAAQIIPQLFGGKTGSPFGGDTRMNFGGSDW